MFRSQNKLPQKVCFGELFRTAKHELRFGLILFEITLYQLVLRSRLKYIGAFILHFWPNLVSVSSKRIAKRMLLAQIKANYSSGADSSSDDENADKEDGDSPKKGKDGAKKQDESGERWFRQGWAISYLISYFFFFSFWLNCSSSQSVSTDRASHFKLYVLTILRVILKPLI